MFWGVCSLRRRIYIQGDPEVTTLTFQNEIQSRHAITQIEINMIFKVLIKKFKLNKPATVVFVIKGKYFPLFSLALSL